MTKKPGNIFLLLLRICFLILPALCSLHGVSRAQDSTKAQFLKEQQPGNRADSLKPDSARMAKKDTVPPLAAKPFHNPRKAALFSAVLPGLGQAYNHEYWKMPLVYAALGISAGTFIFNMDKYRTFRDAYRIRMDGNADTQDEFVTRYPDERQLKVIRDAYRQYVDYSVLVFVLAYGLNIVDATVFAHLKNFDMSDDLGMKVVPAVIDNRAIGFSVRVNLGGGKKKTGKNQLALSW